MESTSAKEAKDKADAEAKAEVDAKLAKSDAASKAARHNKKLIY